MLLLAMVVLSGRFKETSDDITRGKKQESRRKTNAELRDCNENHGQMQAINYASDRSPSLALPTPGGALPSRRLRGRPLSSREPQTYEQAKVAQIRLFVRERKDKMELGTPAMPFVVSTTIP